MLTPFALTASACTHSQRLHSRPAIALTASDCTHGQRTFKCFAGKDSHQEVVIPVAHS